MKIQKLFLNKASLLIFAVAMCFGLAQVTLAAGAHESDNPPCYDITGASTPLNVGGVPNGGTMDFDDVGVAAAYQACVRMSSNLANAVPARLEGWVWDSNLGWVSLYCPGGGGAVNLGVLCGSQAYSVTFATTGGPPPADFTTVKLIGNAWGDNIGYISFYDTVFSFFQTAPIASGINKGLIDTSMGAPAYHAWADAVGWLDLRGVHLYWYDTDPPLPAISYTSIYSSNDPGYTCDLASGCVLTDPTKIPNADGGQQYVITIPFVDGVRIDSSKIVDCGGPTSINLYTMNANIYCAKIALTWEDDVDYDQTTAASQRQATPKFNTLNLGAVAKPLNFALSGGDFAYDVGDVSWKGTVKSLAPTSDRNMTGGMQNEKFYYAYPGGLPDGYDKTKTDQNKLILKELKLMFFKYSTDGITPGKCIYGNISGSDCVMKNYVSNVALSFNPLVEVSELLYKKASKWINFIDVSSIDNEQDFKEQLSINGSALSPTTSFNIGLENPGGFHMKWVDIFPDSEITPTRKDITNVIDNIPHNPMIAQIFSDTPGASITSDAGPYVYTRISYNIITSAVNPIVYFGAKLPRVKAGLLLNPVAKVEGNVYVTDFAQKAADFSLRSLGNISSNLRREAVVRNVAKYLAGYSGGSLASGDKSITVASNYNSSGLTELVKDKVYYLKDGNLTFNCGAACTFDKSLTFIVENGNIFVNSDIRSSGGTQIGLIALRDLALNKQNEGFLYLSKNVGWLQNVQIYLDRLMQSYDPAGAGFDPTNGFALMAGDDYARQDTFNNQLVIEGTLSSMNGVGNASRATPVYETGAVISPLGSSCASYSGSLSGICRARVADLNYMRYYGPGLALCLGGEGPGAVANVPQDQALYHGGIDPDQGCNPSYAGYAIDASGLYADPSTSSDNGPGFDLVAGGGSGAQSLYFASKPATLQNEYPVNFFYKPIAKDLAGFEVDQNINQVTQ